MEKNKNNLSQRKQGLGEDKDVRIEEEIKKTDAEIDELVYRIYGITDEEKKIIEESLK